MRRGEVGEADTAVLLVTGNGLKTPLLVKQLVRPIAG